MSGSRGEKPPGSVLRHDLRTPINQIVGYGEMLEEDAAAAGQESVASDLRKIVSAARTLLGLVDTIPDELSPRPAAPAPRLMILFPAIAVDAPGASARNAFADSKGFFWDMFFICLVAMLPLVVLTMLLVVLEWPLELRGSVPALWTVLEVTDKTVVELVAFPLYVAIASRIFHALGERVLHRYPERAA